MSRGKGLPQNLPTLEVSHHPLLETSMRPSLGFFLKLCKSTESKKKIQIYVLTGLRNGLKPKIKGNF